MAKRQWLILRDEAGGDSVVEARLDIPPESEQPELPDRADYGFGGDDYRTVVGDYPNAYRGYRLGTFHSEFIPGELPPLPINPKASWSERLDDMRTFAEFKTLLMECPEILAVGGYMNAARRQAHDSIRPPNALTPPPPPSDAEDGGDNDGGGAPASPSPDPEDEE